VAQGAPPVLPRARVTVDSSFGPGNVRFTGAVSSWSVDSITLLLKDGGTLSLPREHITRLEVSKGTRSQVGKGVVKGVFIGAAVGAVRGAVKYNNTDQDAFYSYGPEVIPTMALGGALWGVAIGAVAGALSREPDWQDADHRVGLSPSGIGLAVRF
jgi:hypothetical protein